MTYLDIIWRHLISFSRYSALQTDVK